MDSYREFIKNCEAAVWDVLGDLDDADLGEALRHGFDEVDGIADSCVPVYNQETVNVMIDGSLMHVEPELEAGRSAIDVMRTVLYEEASQACYRAVEEFQEDEADQWDRFKAFLGDYPSPERLECAEDACDAWTDDPRRGTDGWPDDPEWYEECFNDWKGEWHETVRDLCDPAYTPKK